MKQTRRFHFVKDGPRPFQCRPVTSVLLRGDEIGLPAYGFPLAKLLPERVAPPRRTAAVQNVSDPPEAYAFDPVECAHCPAEIAENLLPFVRFQ